jgi:hypothetical protein
MAVSRNVLLSSSSSMNTSMFCYAYRARLPEHTLDTQEVTLELAHWAEPAGVY